MSTIQDFLSNIRKDGLALNNRFKITFGLPIALQNFIVNEPEGTFNDGTVRTLDLTVQKPIASDDSTRSLSIMCQSVSIPGINISVQEMKTGTYTRKIPFSKQYGEFDVTFISSGKMKEKKLFDSWINIIFDHNNASEYYNDIISEIDLDVLGRSNEVIYRTRILEVFPTVITPIAFDRSAPTGTQTFQVTFAYWKTEENENPVTSQIITTDNVWDVNRNYPGPDVGIFGIPGMTAVMAVKEAYSIYRQIDSIKREIEKGLDPQGATRILKELSNRVRNLTGLPTSDADKLMGHINDIIFALNRR